MHLRTIGGFAYRAISKALGIFFSFLNISTSIPHFTTVRLWSLRLGLFQLNKEIIKSDDWIYIIDASIKCGPKKCLVILGVRLSAILQQKKNNLTLRHEDVNVIDLFPTKRLTGEVVFERIQKACERTGPPLSTVIDRGGEMKKGERLFSGCGRCNDKYFSIFDIPHKLASLFESIFSKCERWCEFSKKVTYTKLQVIQTDLSCIAPPAQRSVSRYMNVDIQIDWGMAVINAKKQGMLSHFPKEKVTECVGWLDEYESFINTRNQMVKISELIKASVREKGLHVAMYNQLEEDIRVMPQDGEIVVDFVNRALNLLKEEVDKVPSDIIAIGTTEVLESAFGKYKELAHQYRGNLEISSNTLNIPLFVGEKITVQTIKEGLEGTKCSDFWGWCKKEVGETIAGSRRKILGHRKKATVNSFV